MPLDTCVGSRFEQLTLLPKSLHPANLPLSEIWSWLTQNTKSFSACLLIPLFLLHYWLWVTINSFKRVTQLRVFLFTFKRTILFLKTLFPLHSLVDFCLSFIAQLIGITLLVSGIDEIMIEYVIGVNYSNKPKCSIFYAQGSFSNLSLKHSSERVVGDQCIPKHHVDFLLARTVCILFSSLRKGNRTLDGGLLTPSDFLPKHKSMDVRSHQVCFPATFPRENEDDVTPQRFGTELGCLSYDFC